MFKKSVMLGFISLFLAVSLFSLDKIDMLQRKILEVPLDNQIIADDGLDGITYFMVLDMNSDDYAFISNKSFYPYENGLSKLIANSVKDNVNYYRDGDVWHYKDVDYSDVKEKIKKFMMDEYRVKITNIYLITKRYYN